MTRSASRQDSPASPESDGAAAAPTVPRLFIAAHGLIDYHSHFYNEAVALLAACRRRRMSPLLFVHKDVREDIAAELGGIPIFPHVPDVILDQDPLSQPLSDFLLTGAAFAEACRILVARGIGADDWLLLPYASEREIYGLALWLADLPPPHRPGLALVFHLPDLGWTLDKAGSGISGDVSRWRHAMNLLRAQAGGRILIFGVTAALCAAIETATGLPCREVPFPGVHGDEPQASPGDSPPAAPPFIPQAHIRVAGEFRPEKGSELLPEVMKRFARARPGRLWAVQVKSRADSRHLTQTIGAEMERLPLRIAIGQAGRADYARRIPRTDIMLLPYFAERYRMRASGVFSDSVAHGIVTVVPAKSWMAEKLREGWGAGACFERFEPEAIADTLIWASDNLERLKPGATARSAEWRRTNSVDAVLARILEEIGANRRELDDGLSGWQALGLHRRL